MAINVTGNITLKLDFNVRISEMTEQEWDRLSEQQQNHMIESRINFANEMRNAETDEIDVWDVNEVD